MPAGRPAEAIPIEPISGNFSKCITVQSQGEGTLHIEFCKTDGEGWISLLGVAAADTAPQAGARSTAIFHSMAPALP